jgi:hypothetical protein
VGILIQEAAVIQMRFVLIKVTVSGETSCAGRAVGAACGCVKLALPEYVGHFWNNPD